MIQKVPVPLSVFAASVDNCTFRKVPVNGTIKNLAAGAGADWRCRFKKSAGVGAGNRHFQKLAAVFGADWKCRFQKSPGAAAGNRYTLKLAIGAECRYFSKVTAGTVKKLAAAAAADWRCRFKKGAGAGAG